TEMLLLRKLAAPHGGLLLCAPKSSNAWGVPMSPIGKLFIALELFFQLDHEVQNLIGVPSPMPAAWHPDRWQHPGISPPAQRLAAHTNHLLNLAYSQPLFHEFLLRL